MKSCKICWSMDRLYWKWYCMACLDELRDALQASTKGDTDSSVGKISEWWYGYTDKHWVDHIYAVVKMPAPLEHIPSEDTPEWVNTMYMKIKQDAFHMKEFSVAYTPDDAWLEIRRNMPTAVQRTVDTSDKLSNAGILSTRGSIEVEIKKYLDRYFYIQYMDDSESNPIKWIMRILEKYVSLETTPK